MLKMDSTDDFPLPAKRAPEDLPEHLLSSTKKSKAELKRESLARAREWAEDRKRKKEEYTDHADANVHEGEGAKKIKKPSNDAGEHIKGEGANIAEEERGILENLPPATFSRRSGVRRSARRSGNSVASDDESSVMSDSSTRSGRRRHSIDPTKAAKTPKLKRRPRKSSAAALPTQAVLDTTLMEEDGGFETTEKVNSEQSNLKSDGLDIPEAIDEEIEEVERKESVIQNKIKIENGEISPDVQHPSQEFNVTHDADVSNEENEPKKNFLKIFLPAVSVFLHAITLQWTLAFAIIQTFFLDWFVFEFGGKEQIEGNRLASAILGFWLITIAGSSMALGPHSRFGWLLTTSTLAMASFAAKLDLWQAEARGAKTVPPSTPVLSVFLFDINVPDFLVVLGLIGCIVINLQPNEVTLISSEEPAPLVEAPNASVESSRAEGVFNDTHDTENHNDNAKEESGPRSLIGQRLTVEDKNGKRCGSVKDYDAETRFWLVHFDDGEEEEVNRVTLASAFRLHAKDLGDHLKAMWRSGEI